MNSYKIIFADNTILSICKIDGIYFFKGERYHYLNEEGILVYALVRAETKAAAEKIANEIITTVIQTKPRQ